MFVTPDSLGARWADGKLSGALDVELNGQPFGRAQASEDMTFDFGTLIAHAAKSRKLGAGRSSIGPPSPTATLMGGGQTGRGRGSGLQLQRLSRMVETIPSRRAGNWLPQVPATESQSPCAMIVNHPISGTIDQQVVAPKAAPGFHHQPRRPCRRRDGRSHVHSLGNLQRRGEQCTELDRRPARHPATSTS